MSTTNKIGTLILIEVKDYGDKPNKAGEICMFGYGMNIAGKDNMGYPTIKPFIVCDDRINDGDTVYNGVEMGTVHKWDKNHKQPENIILVNYDNEEILERRRDRCFKVIVTPDQFSESNLREIVDGRVKNGDKVEVEMETVYIEPDDSIHCNRGSDVTRVRLIEDGTAIVHLHQEDVATAAIKWSGKKGLLYGNIIGMAFKAGAEWKENQNK